MSDLRAYLTITENNALALAIHYKQTRLANHILDKARARYEAEGAGTEQGHGPAAAGAALAASGSLSPGRGRKGLGRP